MGLGIMRYPKALAGTDEALRLYRALACTDLSVRGLMPVMATEIDAAVDAMSRASGQFDSLSFTGGTMNHQAWSALALLAPAGCGYLDIRTHLANLRVWPHETWVAARLPDGLAPASQLLGTALVHGKQAHDGLAIEVLEGRYQLSLEAKTPERLFEVFRALAGESHDTGHAARVSEAASEPLRAFVHALGARLEVNATLPFDVCVAMCARFAKPHWKWWFDEVEVQFPDGAIVGYAPLHLGQKAEDDWLAKVTAAMERAGLG